MVNTSIIFRCCHDDVFGCYPLSRVSHQHHNIVIIIDDNDYLYFYYNLGLLSSIATTSPVESALIHRHNIDNNFIDVYRIF
jgi:hypothetical protein